VASHVVPSVVPSNAMMSDPKRVPTLQRGSAVTPGRSGSRLSVTDAQGNTATVTKADIKAGASVIHTINRVLRGGEWHRRVPGYWWPREHSVTGLVQDLLVDVLSVVK